MHAAVSRSAHSSVALGLLFGTLTIPCPERRGFRPRGPGFLDRRRAHPREPGMSDLSSAGIARGAAGYGTTCRNDVLRGVDVPVVPGAARRASPLPDGQAQLRQPVPARRACLAGGVPAADHDQLATVPGALVHQLAAELARPAVRDCAGEPPVAKHAGHVQVLDHGRIPRKRCLCRPGASGPGGRPRCGSTRAGRSRRYGSASAAAPGRGRLGTGTPSSSSHYRTCDRESTGAAPYGLLYPPTPMRGAPDSFPA
jgi:hypothetical protein